MERLKNGTRIEVHDLSELDRLVTTIHINKDKGLVWRTGEFNTSMLSNENYCFELIENKINIQDIEECDINVSCQELDHNIRDLESYTNNIVLLAIKQLDREIKEIKSLNIEINEEDINKAIKNARKQMREE